MTTDLDDWEDLDEGLSDAEVLVPKSTTDRPACFSFMRKGQRLGGFVVLSAAGPRAFVNRCPHVPYPLDFGDGDVLHEGQIVCVNHGARFALETGACTWGPARGRSLEALPLEDLGERWRVRLPQPAPAE